MKAGLAVRDSIRKVQREMENEFHLFGAITAGTISELETGVKVTTGSPEQVAARFREHAAPSQLLLSDEVWQAVRDHAEVAEAVDVTVPGSDPVRAYPLSGLRV